MGDVHKFRPRPKPKNEGQFRGYRPEAPSGLVGRKSRRRQLRDWQKTVIAWSVLVLVALGFWGIGRLL